MAGLRERQKANRTRRIIEAASTLFRAQGYDAVRIEDIAAAADVSTGTCYNYFSTKGDILLAIVSMEVEEVIDAGRAVVADPPSDIADALDRLVCIYYDHSLLYLTKELWRRAVALSVEAPETPFSQRYLALDARLTAQVADLVTALQQRGSARRGLDAEALGGIIFAQLNQAFIGFVTQDAMPLAQLHRTSRRVTDQLAQLMASP
ncbi:MAG: TetR/AcrR family transcriptional regulator [Rhodobacterales bacterium]|nr:TetR/AcrR family transcriptional regulator [Rhodobacterales bacterium]